MDAQKFCLKWDGFQGSVTSVFDHLRQDSELVDVTLCSEGKRVRAHRMMLSACSPYFRELFKDLTCQQLVIFLKDTSAADLTAIVEFMYKGSVNVAQSQLASFIKTAEMLQVQGLSGGEEKDPPPPPGPPPPPPPEPARARSYQQQQPASPAAGLRRVSDTAGSPAEPRLKRRRAEPPPMEMRASPPPPPPPVVPPVTAVSGSVVKQEAAEQQMEGQFESPVKMENYDVDLTLDDDDEEAAVGPGEDLEAALGHVAQYEGYDPGSDQSLSADGQMFAADAAAAGDGTMAGNVGPGGPYTPGPSQRTGEDGSQGFWGQPRCDICGACYKHRHHLLEHIKKHSGETRCPICGATYSHRRSLTDHMKKHSGQTRCPVCRKEFSMKQDMRRHMVELHNMSRQEVDRLTNKGLTSLEVLAHARRAQSAL